MGLGTESAMLNQLKKAQGETNARLDRIIALLEEQTRLAPSMAPPVPVSYPPPVARP